MRLRQLGLEHYGNFAAQRLELDPAPGRINLLVAPNGAGKSVLRQAISELLFGIHTQTPMGTEATYHRMRLRAEAVFADGRTIPFVRRKGTRNVLSAPDDAPLDDTLPSRLPRESERKRLERLFVLDSAQLRAGGKALLQTDGDLADALLSSAGDLGSARALAADLADRRDAVAPLRRSVGTPFHKACDEFTAAGKRLGEALVRPPTVAEQERQRADAVRARDEAMTRHTEAMEQTARLGRVRLTRRHLAALDAADVWLAAHRDAPVLPPGTGDALAAAKAAAEKAAHDAEAACARNAELDASLADASVDEAALAEADAIGRLIASGTQSEQSRADIPKRQHELDRARGAIDRLLRALSSTAGPADAATELRAAADIAAARELAAEAGSIAQARAEALATVQRERDAITAAEDDLVTLPAATGMEALRAAHDEAVADGDPARLSRQAQAAVDEAAADAEAALARVPGWHGDAAALAALEVPAEATLARLDRALAAAQAAQEAAARREAEAEAALADARARLDRMTGARALPDEAALAAARAHRDRGWTLVFARLGGTPDPAAEADYRPGTPLPLAFERAMAAADDVADRRVTEADQVAGAAVLQAAISRAQATLAAAAPPARGAEEAASRAGAAWAAAMASAGLGPAASPAEARALLNGRAAAMEAVAAHRAMLSAAGRLAERQAGWAANLAAAMATTPDTLPRLVLAARQRLDEAQRTAAQRQGLARTLATARRAAADAAPALERAEAAMAAWRLRWEAAMQRLRLPADTTPGVANAVLDLFVDLPAQVREADVAQGRLTEMQAQLHAFAAGTAEVAARLGEPPGPPEALVRRLTQRLATARAASGARDTLARQAEDAAERERAAASLLAHAMRMLDGAVRATGADTLEAAERRVALALERAEREDARAAAELGLREDGEGLDVASLRAEAAATPAEAIGEATRLAEAAITDANQAGRVAVAQLATAESALKALAAGEEAARAAADRQAAAARISRVLEDALVQHLAAAMLNHALEQVEASSGTNQRLLRIGETFRTLTGGAYDRLSPAEEDRESQDHGRLIAHEPGGADRHIARLSEGTRDQLYLALRLVAVEDHVRGGAPALPFIADDVLQTFDDERAHAAMQALARLSEHVQVLVLTHHPHLVPLTAGLPVHIVTL